MICSYLLRESDVILILKLHRKSALTHSFIHSLKIGMMSYPCNKYVQIMSSYLSSVSSFEDKTIHIFQLMKDHLVA